MPESSLISGLLTFVFVCWFMVACPVGCLIFSIFSDTININGPFEKIGIAFTNLIFAPLIMIGNIIDGITSPFVSPEMRTAINNRNNLRA